ncbi:hypothetical protein AB0O75_40095 [Streptomyces sp. NPDC088921]
MQSGKAATVDRRTREVRMPMPSDRACSSVVLLRTALVRPWAMWDDDTP